ncbi:DUF1080 domain-containing protein [Aureibaculum sp. A20]|uniref:DUF1080 domain-containing protein n=1 Tax=Aureibaculum flavum TaxID=2795986 RepID=A0ABS0WSM7_9FLAO|nr:DUF1080 domain-containing protein [Aureibaculum flavum]MBJ2174973.1 DUF1080 domain-containing protein [Aureibaculum flavum]
MYKKINLIYICLLIFVFFSCKTKTENEKTANPLVSKITENWISLFNGKDLEGWTPKIRGYALGENIHNTFRVEDEVIKVSYDEYEDGFKETFGHLFYKTPFSNYRLRMEYRFTGTQLEDGPGWAERNSGVMIHCEDPKKMNKDQKFPLCIEVQMLGGINSTDPRSTANLCTPGTNVVMDGELVTAHCNDSNSSTYYGEQWVALEVEVHNDSLIIHKINDKEVMRYSKPQIGGADMDDYSSEYKERIGESVKGGYFSLQSESHPVEFRKIELMELK